MKNLNYFYDYAEKNNLKIKSFKDNERNIDGLCLYKKNKCNIYINKAINNETVKKCVLAEEIGHFKKGIQVTNLNDISSNAYLIRSINEFRAKKWAVNELIPFSTFKSFLGTNYSKFDIANKLDVTEELVDLACFIYEPLLYN